MATKLHSVLVRPVEKSEESRYRDLMAQHHYLGDLAKIGHTLWYVATHGDDWVALLSFSACAWKCGVRDRWIGWNFQNQYDRLHLIATLPGADPWLSPHPRGLQRPNPLTQACLCLSVAS